MKVWAIVAAILVIAAPARADACDHVTNLAILEERALQADRCRMEMHIWRAEKGECASYWALAAKGQAAMECLSKANESEDPAEIARLDLALDRYEAVMGAVKAAHAKMMATRDALPR